MKSSVTIWIFAICSCCCCGSMLNWIRHTLSPLRWSLAHRDPSETRTRRSRRLSSCSVCLLSVAAPNRSMHRRASKHAREETTTGPMDNLSDDNDNNCQTNNNNSSKKLNEPSRRWINQTDLLASTTMTTTMAKTMEKRYRAGEGVQVVMGGRRGPAVRPAAAGCVWSCSIAKWIVESI